MEADILKGIDAILTGDEAYDPTGPGINPSCLTLYRGEDN